MRRPTVSAPRYRIYIEVEKVTEDSYDRRERFLHEDVTLEATDFAWSYEASSLRDVRLAAEAIHDFAQGLVPNEEGSGSDGC